MDAGGTGWPPRLRIAVASASLTVGYSTRSTTAVGPVISVRGAVVDVRFDGAVLPAINSALVVEWDRPDPTQRAPALNLAPDALLSGRFAAYLHAQLCIPALHAFAAQNEARMEAMAARNQVVRQLATMQTMQRRVRQEEIIELAAGETASQDQR